MTRRFSVEIQIDELKLSEEQSEFVNQELSTDLIESAVKAALEEEGVDADVFVKDVPST